jgi:GNAT superfamily N-acetyltransferase
MDAAGLHIARNKRLSVSLAEISATTLETLAAIAAESAGDGTATTHAAPAGAAITDLDVHIRRGTLRDLETVLGWAAVEGWVPGTHDAVAFFAAFPRDFFFAVDSRTDALLGSLAVVRYDAVDHDEVHDSAGASAAGDDDDDPLNDRHQRVPPSYVFGGLYLVHADARSHGIGHMLYNTHVARLVSVRSAALDGVRQQQGTYESLGFRAVYDHVRYCAASAAALAAATALAANADGIGFSVAQAGEADAEELIAYDRQFVPAPRDAFTRVWLQRPRECFVARDSHNRTVVGVAVVRESHGGTSRLGPVYAESSRVAQSLLQACAECAVEHGWLGTVHVDVPSVNEAASALFAGLGMEAGFTCARMYRGEVPTLPLERLFGVATLELG